MNRKMYGLNGALISTSIFLLMLILLNGVGSHPSAIIIPLLPGYLVAFLFPALDSLPAIVLSSLIIFFTLGSFLGVLYGKIKNRNKIM